MRSDGVAAALAYLREGIVAGQLTPGEKLNQEDIAQALGMSRIPVREALGILASEGAVEYVKNRGYTVPKMSVETLDEIYRMRTLLESDVLRHIHEPSTTEIRDLHAINDRMRTAADSGNLADFIASNRSFHFAVFELGDSPLMTQMIDRLWSLSESYRALYLYDSRNAVRSAQEHRELIDALARMDLERCVSISDEHRRKVQDHVRGFLLTRVTPPRAVVS